MGIVKEGVVSYTSIDHKLFKDLPVGQLYQQKHSKSHGSSVHP